MNRIVRSAVFGLGVLCASPVAAQQVISDVKLFADEEIRIKAPAKIDFLPPMP